MKDLNKDEEEADDAQRLSQPRFRVRVQRRVAVPPFAAEVRAEAARDVNSREAAA